MTFSLVARCVPTGRFAVSVTSSSPAVGARCAYARAGLGAVTTQNVTDPRLGPRALDLLALGADAAQAAAVLRTTAPHAEHRQFTIIDASGQVAWFSGAKVLGLHASAQAENAVSAGNMLANKNVPRAVIAAFESAPDQDIGSRVIAAMQAGLAAGGEAGPLHSAALIMVDETAWPVADLRVDWSDTPIADLACLWSLWHPQMDSYITRALNPEAAPSYGVPGDE